MYRDASNYKECHSIVAKGELSEQQQEDIRNKCDTGCYFIPQQVNMLGLQDRMTNFPNEDDHVWHEINDVRLVEDKPNFNLTAGEIHALFMSVGEWQVAEYTRELGIPIGN
jgi:hypothetical protein